MQLVPKVQLLTINPYPAELKNTPYFENSVDPDQLASEKPAHQNPLFSTLPFTQITGI